MASNSSLDYLQKNLNSTGLDRYFENRVYSAKQVARPKPDPDLFLYAANQLGYSPQDCLVIEDSVAGITAGQSAGMTVVGFMAGLHVNQTVRQRIQTAQPDHVCDDAVQLEKLIINFK